jgi:hypothetical protein
MCLLDLRFDILFQCSGGSSWRIFWFGLLFSVKKQFSRLITNFSNNLNKCKHHTDKIRSACIWQTLAIMKIHWSSESVPCRGTDHISKPRKGVVLPTLPLIYLHFDTVLKKTLLTNQRAYLRGNTVYHLPSQILFYFSVNNEHRFQYQT